MLYLLSTSCVLTLAYSTLFPLGDTLLLLSSCRREGVHPELPGVRGLLGVRLPVDVPVAPCFREFLRICISRFRCIRHFVIIVINNTCTRFIISFYVIYAMIYCSFCFIYVWLDLGTYMIARFMSFYKLGVTVVLPSAISLRSWTFVCHSVIAWPLFLLIYLAYPRLVSRPIKLVRLSLNLRYSLQ